MFIIGIAAAALGLSLYATSVAEYQMLSLEKLVLSKVHVDDVRVYLVLAFVGKHVCVPEVVFALVQECYGKLPVLPDTRLPLPLQYLCIHLYNCNLLQLDTCLYVVSA